MINRKKFIKISSLSAIALGSGYSLGKLFPAEPDARFAVYGFLPSSDKILKKVIKSFIQIGYGKITPTIMADDYYKTLIMQLYRSQNNFSTLNNYTVTYRIIQLQKTIDADIILSDNSKSVYSPHTDFNKDFLNLRTEIKNLKAAVFFSAEYNRTNILSSFINPKHRKVIVENENRIIEKFPLGSSYKDLIINGPVGQTIVEINDNQASIKKSSCRNKICERSGIVSLPGDIIACAPNRLLIRIEET
jgi:hypothetical protein